MKKICFIMVVLVCSIGYAYEVLHIAPNADLQMVTSGSDGIVRELSSGKVKPCELEDRYSTVTNINSFGIAFGSDAISKDSAASLICAGCLIDLNNRLEWWSVKSESMVPLFGIVDFKDARVTRKTKRLYSVCYEKSYDRDSSAWREERRKDLENVLRSIEAFSDAKMLFRMRWCDESRQEKSDYSTVGFGCGLVQKAIEVVVLIDDVECNNESVDKISGTLIVSLRFLDMIPVAILEGFGPAHINNGCK